MGPGGGASAQRHLPQAQPRLTRDRWAGRAFAGAVLVSLVVLFSPSTPSEGGLHGLDKAVHALLFCALAASTRWRWGRGLWAVIGYAVLSEVLQATLPIHRDGDVFDALADSAGALCGWLLAVRLPQGDGHCEVRDHTG